MKPIRMINSNNSSLESINVIKDNDSNEHIKEWEYYRLISNQNKNQNLKNMINKLIVELGIDYFTCSLILDFFNLNIELNQSLTISQFITLNNTLTDNFKKLLFLQLAILTLCYYLSDKNYKNFDSLFLEKKLNVYLKGLDNTINFLNNQNNNQLNVIPMLNSLLNDISIVRNWLKI
ncbi:hypothetical protein K502DRAFT_367407 [Neoconidiobolus thromboides FSU 785]|nr:hypothetical protein K502DRAFT_367407 [Neoconidiobolus thromboides FSU 785]